MTGETNAQILFPPLSSPLLSGMKPVVKALHNVGFLTAAYVYNAL
jgi:hypothetical protein